MTPTEFRTAHPDVYFLDPGKPESLASFLVERSVLEPGEAIETAARAGEGNMNCTVRVATNRRSFIVKQARPWVEKYPQFAAPWDRACREAEFYRLIAGQPEVAGMMPRLLDFDPKARVLVLEDLGVAKDYTGTYRGEVFAGADILKLAGFLSALHAAFAGSKGHPLTNREMRELNHAHLFYIPLLKDNGLNLDSITAGLAEAGGLLKDDANYRREVERLGREVYLADGPCLLHGDFFPGSLIRTPVGPRVIDPEFGYFGRPEFDLAILVAHLLLGNQPATLRAQLRNDYSAPPGFDDDLMLQLAGVEIMRRLIGYAQLPVGYGLEQKRELLELSRKLVLEPRAELLVAV